MYDVEYNPVQTFKFLTPQHFEPGSAEKMRNYLADDVLGKRMVEIVQVMDQFHSGQNFEKS